MKRIKLSGQEEDASFDLPVENELLMLKLKAEFGAECKTVSKDIPPAVVNEFLRSVYAFEQKFRETREPVRIFDKIGQPFFRKAEELSDKLLPKELKRLLRLMQEHRLELDVLGKYPDRTIYTFLTEEFFQHEMEDLALEGYINHFCYEEFHPNHEMDIRQRCVEFITQWFGRKINEYSWQLGDPFIHPDTRQFSKSDVLSRINNLFASYPSFSNCEYMIRDITYSWDNDAGCGTAYVDGKVKYDALTEDKNLVHIEGNFQFYLSNNSTWWSFFYFVFPGFYWNE